MKHLGVLLKVEYFRNKIRISNLYSKMEEKIIISDEPNFKNLYEVAIDYLTKNSNLNIIGYLNCKDFDYIIVKDKNDLWDVNLLDLKTK